MLFKIIFCTFHAPFFTLTFNDSHPREKEVTFFTYPSKKVNKILCIINIILINFHLGG